jgi:serine/threonine-protein kinase RsbW
MRDQLEVELKNSRVEIQRVHQIIREFGRRHNLSAEVLNAVELTLEEHLTNIISYGFSDAVEHPITLRLALLDDEMRLEVEDDGRPFNPLEHPAPDTSIPLEAKPIGGLGIHLMRKMMDAIEYSRCEGRNILVMKKRFR